MLFLFQGYQQTQQQKITKNTNVALFSIRFWFERIVYAMKLLYHRNYAFENQPPAVIYTNNVFIFSPFITKFNSKNKKNCRYAQCWLVGRSHTLSQNMRLR